MSQYLLVAMDDVGDVKNSSEDGYLGVTDERPKFAQQN